MELPRIQTEVPRHHLTKQIREHLPRTSVLTKEHGDEYDLMTLYRALDPADRATVYRMALTIAERSAIRA